MSIAHNSAHFVNIHKALPGVLWKRGTYLREQRPFEGNKGTKTILRNSEHKKTNFQFWGNRGTSQSGKQGNRYPLSLGRVLFHLKLTPKSA